MAQQNSIIWYSHSGDDALKELDTDSSGLSQNEVETRIQRYGPNTIKSQSETSAWKILFHQIASPLIYVLLAAMIVTIGIQHWADTIVIGIVVVLNTVIGFIQEYRAENAIQALIKMSAPKATVRRNGNEETIDSSGLVPGDIVLLETGDIVPADVRLLESLRLQIDESLLTGESMPSQKSTGLIEGDNIPVADQENIAFMGTSVTSGKGSGVAVATGTETQMGSIATDIMTTSRAESPLQNRMKSFAKWISIIIVAVAVIAFGAGLAIGEPLIDMFLTAVSLAVSAMPEGLPVVMTIALAVSIQRMAKRNAVLRRLPAAETLGSCTVILSDKTGTLTQNKMAVQRIWTGDIRYRITGCSLSSENNNNEKKQDTADIKKESPLYETLLAGVLANEASLAYKDGETITKGDPTEIALLISGNLAGMDSEKLLNEYHTVDLIPFDSKQRYSARIHIMNENKIAFVKGATERVVKMCNSVAGQSGPTDIDMEKILEEADQMAKDGLRVLAMAK
ncbi:MAG: HAD-IC family P-type ATPase, partial [Dehalococcoidia bacterium]